MSGERRIFIFGLGPSALALACRLKSGGWEVAGTTRSGAKREALQADGIRARGFDDVTQTDLRAADAVLVSTPTVEGEGDPVLARYGAWLAEAMSEKKKPWLGYLSTTGVYGDWNGEWVDESSATRAGNARLERRLEAEENYCRLGGHVFRLAGIYGPHHSAIDDVLAGEARRIYKEGQVFSRIHVDDIAGALAASIHAPSPGSRYNVSDDEPAPAHEVVACACELLGKEPPPLVDWKDAGLSAMGREFYNSNRRVSNRRLKENLGYRLLYPTYREGLRAIAKSLELTAC